MDGAILATLKGLLVDLDIQSSVKLDDSKANECTSVDQTTYPSHGIVTVPLHFPQNGVPTIEVARPLCSNVSSPDSFQTDNTVLYLITVVAPPIVQTLVNQLTLTFSEANLTFVDKRSIQQVFKTNGFVLLAI